MSMLLNRTAPISLCCAAALLVAGCASKPLTKEECQTDSTYQMGLSDGNAGENPSKFAIYQRQCDKFKFELDQKSYNKGWTTGNQSYCQPSTAFSLGKSGEPYPMICTDYDIDILRAEYNRGFQVHQRVKLVEQQLRDIEAQENQGSYITAEMHSVSERLAEVRSDLVEGRGDAREAHQEIDELNTRLESLKIQLTATTTVQLLRGSKLEEQKAALYRKMDQLKATI